MFRLMTCIRVVLILLLTCAGGWAQADFSADIVNLMVDRNTFHTKIFSTKDKYRLQGEDKSGRANSISIVNLATRISIVLMPQQHQYVENKLAQIPGQGVTFFQAKDVEDACGEYQRLSQTEKGKCRKVGHETVNGRDTVRYEIAPGQGNTGPMWIDVKLHFPVKWQNAVSSAELRDIKEETQPPELFEIPAGYTKRTVTTPAKPKPAQP